MSPRGVPLALVSREFRERFEATDLVIAKGAANFETLEKQEGTKYFCLRVKCDVVARHLGVARGAGVLMRG